MKFIMFISFLTLVSQFSFIKGVEKLPIASVNPTQDFDIYKEIMDPYHYCKSIEDTTIQKSQNQIKIVSFSGSGYELGLQHGTALKKEIDEIIEKWKTNTFSELKVNVDSVLKNFYEYAQFDKAIKKWTPEIYEEVNGIADGSGHSFNEIMVLNLLDEFWVYIDNLENHHCSGIGVPSQNGKPGYIAQNMDLENYTDGFQILMRLNRTDNRPEQLIITYPGCIALTGLNETGIGVCVNTLMQLKASSNGLPVAFVIRQILNSTTKEGLLDFIQNVTHASGQNYIIGIRGEIFDFEASANKVVQFDPLNKNGTVYHTNHPLVNNDVKLWHQMNNPDLPSESRPIDNSQIRLTALENRVKGNLKVDDETIKETLRSKDDYANPVCRSILSKKLVFTFASVIMTFTNKPSMQVTSGPPDVSKYVRFEFTSQK